MDRDLRELLKKWELPDPPAQLDERVMGTYFKRSRHAIFRWRGSVRLPVPVFVLLLLLQLVSVAAILRNRLWAALPQAPVLSMPERVVEIPVIKEKVVTQVVFLPARALGEPAKRTNYPAANAEIEKPHMDLTGFQQVSELQIRVIKGENRNER